MPTTVLNLFHWDLSCDKGVQEYFPVSNWALCPPASFHFKIYPGIELWQLSILQYTNSQAERASQTRMELPRLRCTYVRTYDHTTFWACVREWTFKLNRAKVRRRRRLRTKGGRKDKLHYELRTGYTHMICRIHMWQLEKRQSVSSSCCSWCWCWCCYYCYHFTLSNFFPSLRLLFVVCELSHLI